MSKWQAESSQTADDMAAMSEAGEEQLLAAAQQFDAVALGELYDRYEAKIYHYIYRRCGEQVVAEDLHGPGFPQDAGVDSRR